MTRVKSLRHFGLVVKNLEQAIRFYTQGMGLRVASAATESGSFIDVILDSPNVCVQTVKLQAVEGETLLELLCFVSPCTESASALRTFYTQGPTHLAFTVDDLNVLVANVEAIGGCRLSDAQTSPDGKVLVVFCRDMEGNLLELVQPV